MKKLLFIAPLFISFFVTAQNFEKNWNKVIRYENEGRIKSADAETEKILKKAVDDNNEVQIIKCFFYRSKFMHVLEEDAQLKILENLNKIKSKSSIATQALLNTVYAECLKNYLSKNSSKLYNRKSVGDSIGNFLTWSHEDFEKQIALAYIKSIEHEQDLKKTPLQQYEQIFDFIKADEFKRETLYEYVLHENIDYYTLVANGFNLPIDKESAIAPTNVFIAADFSSIPQEKVKTAINLYQKLEAINPSIENRFERVKFCFSYIFGRSIEYIAALESIQKVNTNEQLLQKILIEKAEYYSVNASKAQHPDYNFKTVAILDSILQIDNRSNAYKLARYKKDNLRAKSIQLHLLTRIGSNEQTRVLVKYKNTESINIFYYKLDAQKAAAFKFPRTSNDSLLAVIRKNNPVKTAVQKLPGDIDYFEHSTEFLLPLLDTGTYLAYFETDSYSPHEKAKAYDIVVVSDMTLLTDTKSKTDHFRILNRKTGEPIENAKVQSSKFELYSDKNGECFFTNESLPRKYSEIIVTKDNDTIMEYASGLRYIRNYDTVDDDDEDFEAKVEFYLDRAIYRPGQTVYYKGIAIQNKKGKTSIVPNLKLQLIVESPEGDEIQKFEVTTNKSGSFSGEFILPKNSLTGQFEISVDEPEDIESDPQYIKKKDEHPFWDFVDFEHSSLYFSVEEYKRPKFEVSFSPVKETIAIKQKVKVDGLAKAFAGNSISDAKVSYTITRIFYPNHDDFKRSWNDDIEEIADGEVKTDASGKFQIEFVTEPGYGDNPEMIYRFKIEADVTDINGETHSAMTFVNVGYKTLEATCFIPSLIKTKNKNVLTLNSTNLNGQFTAVDGTVKIYLLGPSDYEFKNRPWEKPELETISATDFKKFFPNEKEYKNRNPEEQGTLVYSKKVNTGKVKSIPLDFMDNYKSGDYKVVFSVLDNLKNRIEDSREFRVLQSKEPYPGNLFTLEQQNDDPKKDGFIEVAINSYIPNISVVLSASYESSNFYEQLVTLNGKTGLVQIPIAKNVANNIVIGGDVVFDNDHFHEELRTTIRRETHALTIEAETFRDKLQPGTPESWTFKISPADKGLGTEVLASMYDSSLDQFTSHDWPGLLFSPPYNYLNQKTPIGFGSANMYMDNLRLPYTKLELNNEKTDLIWFGFDFNGTGNYLVEKQYKKQRTKKLSKPAGVRWIVGVVSDETGTLPGANVVVKGTQRGVQTDIDGYYEIEAAIGEELVFSFVGMNEKTVAVGASNTINVTLGSGVKLNEVVVEGYATKKAKFSLGYSSTKISVEEDNNVFEMLSGRVAGVDIQRDSVGAASGVIIRGNSSISSSKTPLYVVDGVFMTSAEVGKFLASDIQSATFLKDAAATAIYGNRGSNGVFVITTKKAVQELTTVKVRKDMSETAFFYPNLKTDRDGKLMLNFTSPEALTQWKLRLFAHNEQATTGYLEKFVNTQKDLMVMPNFPRFFREKDTIIISCKISNLTADVKPGIAMLQFSDAVNMQSVDGSAMNINNTRQFSVPAFKSATVSWKIAVPEGLQGMQYKIVAKSADFSDGEESIIPVLSSNILVTESIPIWVRNKTKKEYTFSNLKNNTSSTLRNHQLTLEYTSNPIWLAIESLPYLMQYEHECSEQTFARYYANALASEIITSNQKVAAIFDNWRKTRKSTSKLEQNEELKSIILAETPWLADAVSESERKQKMALLFDLEKMQNSLTETFEKLKQKQQGSGGFPWFEGGDANEYITRHILAGLGHLKKLGVKAAPAKNIIKIADKGIPFIDAGFLSRYSKDKSSKQFMPGCYSDFHYLYARSFYLDDYPVSDTLKTIIQRQLGQIAAHRLEYSLYEKAQAALVLNRFGQTSIAKKILENLKETSANNEDIGMYWIANKSGYYWHEAPIETQALLIEAFMEVGNDVKSADAMKVWLIKNKQQKNWPTTKATTEAIYALMMQGNDWSEVKDNTIIKVGNEKIGAPKLAETDLEAQAGYRKIVWKSEEISANTAFFSIENNSTVPGYGGLYWQYFEDLDNIKSVGSNLKISKELYLNKSAGKLEKITPKTALKVGDLVTIRLTVTADEDVEFIHLKDMRASCFEPVSVLSKYHWQDNLGYYMSTKDAATHFFFDRISKGTYILEYEVRVNNIGDFSNGITTIESMYAPEFSGHTKGLRIKIAE